MSTPSRLSVVLIVASIAIGFSQNSFSQDKAMNEKIEKEWKEVAKEGDRQKAEKVKEEMRDKSHDNRLKVGKDTSVGVEKDGVSIKKTIPYRRQSWCCSSASRPSYSY